jgi:hypothetical protein
MDFLFVGFSQQQWKVRGETHVERGDFVLFEISNERLDFISLFSLGFPFPTLPVSRYSNANGAAVSIILGGGVAFNESERQRNEKKK